jgi:hypothetical protein
MALACAPRKLAMRRQPWISVEPQIRSAMGNLELIRSGEIEHDRALSTIHRVEQHALAPSRKGPMWR